jgi:hypothetical protein
MGNRVSLQPKTSQPTQPIKQRTVRIGIMCFDFVPCKHFVHVEGIPGWALYDSVTITKRFIKNPEHFTIDSKFMPELEIARPDASHFELYNQETPEDPDKVLRMHADVVK